MGGFNIRKTPRYDFKRVKTQVAITKIKNGYFPWDTKRDLTL